MRAARRGRFLLQPLQVGTSHPLGLVQLVKKMAAVEEIIVYPRLGELRRDVSGIAILDGSGAVLASAGASSPALAGAGYVRAALRGRRAISDVLRRALSADCPTVTVNGVTVLDPGPRSPMVSAAAVRQLIDDDE